MVVRRELSRGLGNLGIHLSEEDAAWLFDIFDPDQSGKIDAAEFAHLVHAGNSATAMAELQLRVLKRQRLGHDDPRIRALQSADAQRDT